MKVASTLLALLLGVVPVLAKEKKPPVKVEDKIVVLEPMKITGTPVISFAVDLRLYMDPDTKKVDRLFITRVWENSDAEKAGLQVGDEIVKLDGKPVKEFDAVVSVESPLGQLLLERRPGESLKLEVVTRRTEQVTIRARRPTATDLLTR